MIETIFLATVIPLIYAGTGVGIFRKVYYKIKSDYYNDSAFMRKKWDKGDGGWYAAGCMAGAMLWPVVGLFVGLYYGIVSKHTTTWEKEQQLIELQRKNDDMERELKLGKYAPDKWEAQTEKSKVIGSLMDELDRINRGYKRSERDRYGY